MDWSQFNTAPMAGGVATMLYGSAMAQENPAKNQAKARNTLDKIAEMLNPKQQDIKKVDKITTMMVGDLRQNPDMAIQNASATLVGSMPGGATQNPLINTAVAGVMKQTGSMNVPFM